MILRKPYAFLIKNFKQIHIFLLVVSLFVAYMLFDVNGFVGDFMRYAIYDLYSDPITNHITFLLTFSIFMLIVGSIAIMLLLRHKHKPWKLYLIPIIEYIALLVVLSMIKGFFINYSIAVDAADLRFSRDLLIIFIIFQLLTIGIFGMRVFGLDFKKFNFSSDEEFLELSEEDREEFEIGLNIDKNTFIRLYKKTKRNLGYFYLEHKRICIFIIGLVSVLFLYKLSGVFATYRSYNEGSNYNANGYGIVVNNSYFTDKSYNGDIISDKSNFVIIDLTVTNYAAPRTFKSEYLHLKSRNKNYTSTRITYANDFIDLGKTYDNIKELKRGESIRFIEIFRVDKDLKKNSFVLYYQEENSVLRKIKLKIKDISNIEDAGVLKLGEDFNVKYKNFDENVSFEYFEILKQGSYTVNHCVTTGCNISTMEYNYGAGKAVLKITFSSPSIEAKDMVDFSKYYGKIVYIDNDSNEKSIDFKYPFIKTVRGKYLYALVPDEIMESSSVKLVYLIRNKKYTYVLKEGEQNE